MRRGETVAPLMKGQPLVFRERGETPYNVRGTPKASATKFLVETLRMAELTALGMVRTQRIIPTFFLGSNGQSAGKFPTFFL